MKTFDRDEFNANMMAEFDRVRQNSTVLTDADPDSVVFTYLIADHYETLDPELFTYTDGASDMGIDFTVRDGNSFKLYQCKSVEELGPEGSTWGADPVNQLSEAIDYVLDSDATRTANKKVTDFRNDYQLNRDEDDVSLTAVLALEGRLTEQASERFEQIKKQYADHGVQIKLIDETSLFDDWHRNDDLSKPEDIVLKLTPKDDQSILKQKGWLYGIFDIKPLLDGMKQYENGLFDLNVRANLRRTKVNDAIKESLETMKGLERFIHLNNGLVVVCDSIAYKPINNGREGVVLKGAQVINGCQTLSTIWDFYKHATEEQKNNLVSTLKIFAKIISKDVAKKDGLIDDIVLASNNQNAMKSRNLKSNSTEQRNLQRALYSAPLVNDLKYYLVRKDGEIESFLDSKSRSPKKSEFEITATSRRGKNRYRHIDNEDLAKLWWAWIGNASKVNAGGIDYFSKNIYQCIFERKPSKTMLELMAETGYSFDANLLDAGSPTQFQLLLAMAVNGYISCYFKPKFSGNKLKSYYIKQLEERKILGSQHDKQEEDDALLKCNDYLYTLWKNQMSYAMTEVASFILTKKYGPLTSERCQKLVYVDDVRYWLSRGMNVDSLEDEAMVNGSRLLRGIAALINHGAELFFVKNRSAILAQSRPKLYLSSTENVRELKDCCLEANDAWRNQPTEDKGVGQTFLDVLPVVL